MPFWKIKNDIISQTNFFETALITAWLTPHISIDDFPTDFIDSACHSNGQLPTVTSQIYSWLKALHMKGFDFCIAAHKSDPF